uniref:RxLR effector protein n=1 Tax=Angiostrongylus cantonensis TaxID=6313 RepID=A0A158PAY7_ANGCA
MLEHFQKADPAVADHLSYLSLAVNVRKRFFRWEAFTKFGSASATEMTGKNFDKWLKDAGVLDSKNITTTMTGIAFSKVAGAKKKTNFEETKKVIVGVAEDRARQSKKTVQEELDAITEKLARLDAPTLNSRGKAGRVDETINTGYVSSYKNKDTYDKVHGKH